MYFRRFHLQQFRNYRQLDLSLTPGRLLFVGDNAQGKSNLLEAAYLLASGRSPRAGQDSELISRQEATEGQPFARVTAEVEGRSGSLLLEAVILGSDPGLHGARGGKRFRVNGIPRRLIDFAGQLRAVLFTAEDLEVVTGPPALRRQYLDAALSQRDRSYRAALSRYGRVLQQRNASLRRIREGLAGPDELSLWDDAFVQEGSTLIAARQAAVARLAAMAAAAVEELSGTAQEQVGLEYKPQLGQAWTGLLPSAGTHEAVRGLFAAALASQRRREVAAGVSLVGPHRDELVVRLNGAPAAAFASRAQVRTLALALRLAEARLLWEEGGEAPVVLLDDIASEMDERRRDSVLEGLSGFEQLWLTATSALSLPASFVAGCRRFRVRSGTIVEEG